jgi:retinol dehydrogenase-12
MALHDVSYGALRQLYAGTTAEGATMNGKVSSFLFRLNWNSSLEQYFIPWARLGNPRADTQDPQQGKELWDWLEEQVKDI